MATITTNIITLQAKGLLVGQSITLDNNETITVQDYEIDPNTNTYLLECEEGNVHPVDAAEMGTVTVNGITKPTPKNGGKRKKKTKIKK